MSNRSSPNILMVMADQMAGPALPAYGHRVVKTPHISRLVDESVTFDAAYCNFPVCAPSRFSMLSGLYATRIGAYDNAAEFPASCLTLPYYLRALGYHTSLCGKMHFVGPDQLHGYHERLTTDIIGADFALTPDWSTGEPDSPAGATLKTILDAGHCIRSLQIDYDDEVEHCAIQKIYDLARNPVQQPFFLTVSFTHPHAPFTASIEHWNRYRDDEIDLPSVPALPLDKQDMQSVWLAKARESERYPIDDALILNARHAYYGMISYIDDKVGRILDTLRATALDNDTIVIFLSDHGEMMGERGMWFKSTFFEWSARVPLVIRWPGKLTPRRIPTVVSLVDLMPTLIELAGGDPASTPVERLDGTSLVRLLQDGDRGSHPDAAISEFTADGVCAPCRMIRKGPYKYIYVHGHSSQLYDLGNDPRELENLAGASRTTEIERELREALLAQWDPDELTRDILRSQQHRLRIQKLTAGADQPLQWSFKARYDDDTRYVRGAKASEVKARKRFPYVGPAR